MVVHPLRFVRVQAVSSWVYIDKRDPAAALRWVAAAATRLGVRPERTQADSIYGPQYVVQGDVPPWSPTFTPLVLFGRPMLIIRSPQVTHFYSVLEPVNKPVWTSNF